MKGFLISSNIWVGLAVAMLALLSFPQPWTIEALLYTLFLFFATVSAYSYMRWVKMVQGDKTGQPIEVAGFQKSGYALAYTIINGGLALYFLSYILSDRLLWALSPALVIALLYPLAFPHPNQHFTSLRSIPMLKLLLISASWAWLSFAVPMVLEQQVWSSLLLMELLFRTLLIAGLTIPFDVRDIQYDSTTMRTLPQLVGVERSLYIASLLLLIYEIWVIAAFFIWGLELSISVAWLLGLELGSFIIRKVRNHRINHFVGFYVEGIPIYIFILYLLLQLAVGNY
ncbi:MAG: hypothetical protein NXI09_08745 [Bacteroidetes bacterium]|nr:hypothetical protein [Bacteroidota bacterium]